MTMSHASGFIRMKRSSSVMPALLTRMSMRSCFSISAAIRSRRSAPAMSSSTALAHCPRLRRSPRRRPALCRRMRAAQSTVAPLSPRRRAIASPMPREAPVTSATFPSGRSSWWLLLVTLRVPVGPRTYRPQPRDLRCLLGPCGLGPEAGFWGRGLGLRPVLGHWSLVVQQTLPASRDVVHVHQLDRRVDSLDQTRQHAARADFDEAPHSHRDHLLHRLDPSHRRDHLADQRVAHGVRRFRSARRRRSSRAAPRDRAGAARLRASAAAALRQVS